MPANLVTLLPPMAVVTHYNADGSVKGQSTRPATDAEIQAAYGGGGSFDPTAPGPIGAGTPGAATFTNLTTSGTVTWNGTTVTFGAGAAAAWRTALGVPASGDALLVANNLVDVGSASDCRTNLDVYSTGQVDGKPGVNFDKASPGDIGGTTPGNMNAIHINLTTGDAASPAVQFGAHSTGFFEEATNVLCVSANNSKKWTWYDGRTVSYQPLVIEANKSLGFGTTGDGGDVKGSFVKANNGGPNNNPADQVDFTTNGDKVDDGGTLAVLHAMFRSGFTFGGRPDPSTLPNGIRSAIIDSDVVYSGAVAGTPVSSVLSGGGSGTMPIFTSNGAWLCG